MDDTALFRNAAAHRSQYDFTRVQTCIDALDGIRSGDERFLLVLKRLETGQRSYIDAGCFTMQEIR